MALDCFDRWDCRPVGRPAFKEMGRPPTIATLTVQAAILRVPLLTMSRGVVLWTDQATGETVRAIWRELSDAGLPSIATLTHRQHQPHCSLIVGDTLATGPTLQAIGSVPVAPVPLLVESAIVFPGGVLALGCVVNEALLSEQRRVHDAAEPFVSERWRYFIPGRWTPHITLSMGLTPNQLNAALAIVIPHLPVEGTLDRGGIEDGTTGENWPTRAMGNAISFAKPGQSDVRTRVRRTL